MKKITSLFIVSILVAATSHPGFSQSFNDRYFQSIGYSAFLDVFRMPTFTIYNSIPSTPTGLAMISYTYRARVNIYNINDNTSIDVHSLPTVGLSLAYNNSGEAWLGSFSLPLMLGFNVGNVSTYDTKQNHGFGVGLGMEYFQGALFIVQKQESDNRKTGILQPVAELNYRYWSGSNKAKELTFYAGFKGKNASDSVPDGTDMLPSDIHGSFHFRFSWSTYIDY